VWSSEERESQRPEVLRGAVGSFKDIIVISEQWQYVTLQMLDNREDTLVADYDQAFRLARPAATASNLAYNTIASNPLRDATNVLPAITTSSNAHLEFRSQG
jgi:hypothetical protein